MLYKTSKNHVTEFLIEINFGRFCRSMALMVICCLPSSRSTAHRKSVFVSITAFSSPFLSKLKLCLFTVLYLEVAASRTVLKSLASRVKSLALVLASNPASPRKLAYPRSRTAAFCFLLSHTFL